MEINICIVRTTSFRVQFVHLVSLDALFTHDGAIASVLRRVLDCTKALYLKHMQTATAGVCRPCACTLFPNGQKGIHPVNRDPVTDFMVLNT